MTPRPATDSLRRTARSFRYAWEGLVYILRTQPNYRIHLVAALVAMGTGLALRASPVELATLALTSGFVLALEAVNTAIEAAVDAQGSQPSLAAKWAKDAAAAAVLIGAVTAVAVGAFVLIPRVAVLGRPW
jgi:diacylglycerol kinase